MAGAPEHGSQAGRSGAGKSSTGPSRESLLTALFLVRDLVDDESALFVNRFLCDPDAAVSLAAIRAAAFPGNRGALPHLFRLVERAPASIKAEAIGALAAIGEDESVDILVKYFPLFRETEVKRAILETVNRIAPSRGMVSELDRGVLMDETQGPSLKEQAVKGLVRSGDFPFLLHCLPHALPAVQEAVFSEMLEADGAEHGGFLKQIESIAAALAPRATGLYLCAYLFKVRNPSNNVIIEILSGAERDALAAFLSSLRGVIEKVPSVKRVFRILMLLPFRDQETEEMVSGLLLEVLELTRSRSPQAMSELQTLSVVYMDTLFKKVKRDHLSLKGVKERFDLIVVLFARLLERLAPQALLSEIQGFFKDEKGKPPGPLIEKVKSLLRDASDGDRKRFEACVPLFTEAERIRRLNIYSALKNIHPEKPSLLRRFNRVVKAVGWLRVKAVSKKVWEILRFAQEERMPDLEAVCILTLCQLGSRNILVRMREQISDPESGAEAHAAYIAGARHLPPEDVLDMLLDRLLRPDQSTAARASILETLESMDLSGRSAVPSSLLKLLTNKLSGSVKEIAARLLERYATSAHLQSLVALSGGEDSGLRLAAVRALSALGKREKSVHVDVLTHRLYLLLRDPKSAVRIGSLFALLALGDDYAQKILKEWLASERDEVKVELLSRLEQPIPDSLLLHILGLLRSENGQVHEALRRVLPKLCEERFRGEVRRAVLRHLEQGGCEEAAPSDRPAETGAVRSDRQREGETRARSESFLHHPKVEFKFRMEHSQLLTVFFIDVVDYTARSSRRDMSSLMQFVKTFEDIVVPLLDAYNGRIVKKLGDGILAAFMHPLAAVLASLEIQEKVKSHNQFSVGDDRFLVRIGLHTGPVIRKEGDIYGDVVNLAARMQSAAQPGSTLLTEVTFREVEDFIRCREMGKIKLKGFSEEFRAYAPEKVLAVVEEALTRRKEGDEPTAGRPGSDSRSGTGADPLRRRIGESLFSPTFRIPGDLALSRDAVPTLRTLFQEISSAVEQIAGDHHEEYLFKRYLQDKWNEIVGKMNGRGGQKAPERFGGQGQGKSGGKPSQKRREDPGGGK